MEYKTDITLSFRSVSVDRRRASKVYTKSALVEQTTPSSIPLSDTDASVLETQSRVGV